MAGEIPIAIPTCGRLEAIVRCIASFDWNATAHSRDATFVIFDESSESNAGRLRELSRHSTIRGAVTYVGRHEKQALSSELADLCGAPARTVNYALFGLANAAGGSGANRNAILLHHAGRKVISVDDGTVCQPYLLKREVENPTSPFGCGDPTEIGCFADMEDAVSNCEPVSIDFIAAHAAMLGSASASRTDEVAEGAALHARETGARSPVIQCTCNGLIGDSGLSSDLWILLHENPQHGGTLRDFHRTAWRNVWRAELLSDWLAARSSPEPEGLAPECSWE